MKPKEHGVGYGRGVPYPTPYIRFLFLWRPTLAAVNPNPRSARGLAEAELIRTLLRLTLSRRSSLHGAFIADYTACTSATQLHSPPVTSSIIGDFCVILQTRALTYINNHIITVPYGDGCKKCSHCSSRATFLT